jgi:ribosomal protein S18 acetylase RimI-like enzyme
MVRPARDHDAPALDALDRATRTSRNSPAPLPPPGRPIYGPGGAGVGGVLVAERAGRVVGYVHLGNPTPLAAGRHVLQVQGLAVDPEAQRSGIGRLLIEAARAQARAAGARRLTLRVLAGNEAAIRLYRAAGFREEGRLRGEFLIDGEEVDDVLMALDPRVDGSAA